MCVARTETIAAVGRTVRVAAVQIDISDVRSRRSAGVLWSARRRGRVAVWGVGRVGKTAVAWSLKGQGSTSTGGIPSQDLQRSCSRDGMVPVKRCIVYASVDKISV